MHRLHLAGMPQKTPKNAPLISTEEVRAFLCWPLATKPFLAVIFFMLGWFRLNRLYQRIGDIQGIDFIHALVHSRKVKLRYFSSDLARLPRNGPAVLVANHPLGAMDGLLLLQLVHKVRPDVKILGNALLERIVPLRPFLIGVVPFEGHHRRPLESGRGLVRAKKHVEDGGVLIVFPAGEVSHFSLKKWRVVEKPWSSTVYRLLVELRAPVLPVDIHGSLSLGFYGLGLLGAKVRTLLLPGEAARARWHFPVDIRIGKGQRMDPNQDAAEWERKMRNFQGQLRRLPPKGKKPKFFIWRPPNRTAVALQGDPNKFRVEIYALMKGGYGLTRHGKYEVFLAPAEKIPHLLLEIGRLREITFRKVGEGSGLERDLDRYDAVYQHLILWHHGEGQLVGAYRLGFGQELYELGKKKAFYLNEFFKVNERGEKFLKASLEMGRAFVIPEYQQKPWPLFILWKGIMHVLVRHADSLRYVIGSVSVSNSYSKHSQAVMLAFVQHHFQDKAWGKSFKPRKKFKLRLQKEDKAFIRESRPEDLGEMDRMIADIEPENLRMPVLIKKYISQNAKVLAFNRDPAFNTVDALMYMDTRNLPQKTLEPVLEELGQMLPRIEGVDQPEAESC
ncbi:MAG: GNAT family N-acetyltransferase [Flavobacteriia bacterium]|nr:GNAT family N-acetyltransferase [Flavobacteriia bacterium]